MSEGRSFSARACQGTCWMEEAASKETRAAQAVASPVQGLTGCCGCICRFQRPLLACSHAAGL